MEAHGEVVLRQLVCCSQSCQTVFLLQLAHWRVSSPAKKRIEAANVEVTACCSRSGLPQPGNESDGIWTVFLALPPGVSVNVLCIGRDVVEIASLLNKLLEGLWRDFARHWVNSACAEVSHVGLSY